MEDVINKLIEIDKDARKRVAKAKKSQLKGVASLDSRREEILKNNEEEFNRKIAELKSEREALFEKKQKSILESGEKRVFELEKLAETETDAWIQKIYDIVTE